LEIRGYAFNILLNEFEKEENENKQNLVNDFINNNLKKLINELEKFSNEKNEKENKESKIITFYNFYLSNLKIIFYAFKKYYGK
jgi:DNA integrity scanning protein DisA with diadenylate cyclase activity